MAKMSAQETTPGHTFSTRVLMLSITSNPLTEFTLGLAFFSPVKLEVSSRRSDPSQPCRFKREVEAMRVGQLITLTKQSWKNRRTTDAPKRLSPASADRTTGFTVLKRLGQDEE
ncbi:unnamed protein product [Spirodela intermedia]|uniref:Uncharacterized protein n=1 Tax=Spirodela intermedia TaxID=51605 RepID=A0A7I8IC70_SPIIN|nr:unnamed protein product [Spirodela intermedia]CAA6654652.1 unnamed protein product [Spirodela intermedia]